MEKLVKKQDAVEDCVRAIEAYINPYRDAEADLSRLTIHTMLLKQTAIQNSVERYEKLYEEITVLERDQAGLDGQKRKYFDFINLASIVDSDLELLKNRLPNNQVNAQGQNPDNANHDQDWAKMPKRDLPKFSGQILDWPEFIDIFTTEVIRCPKFTDCLRLGYLKKSMVVDSEPSCMLKNLKQTNDNFQIALALLKDRYEDTDLIRDAYFEKIFTIKRMSSDQSATSLRHLSTMLIENIQGLKNMKEPVDKWDSWLVYYVKTKLDSTTRKEWETHLVTTKTSKPTIQTMISFLNQTARTLETCQVKPVLNRKFQGPRSIPSQNRSLVGRESNFACYVCDKNHFMSTCPLFLSVNASERRRKVEELGLCTNCFSRAHEIDQCPKSSICKGCVPKHHPTLHIDQLGGKLPTTSKRAKLLIATGEISENDDQDNGQDGQSDVDSETEIEHIVGHIVSSQEVLLSTILVKVDTPAGFRTCRCLVDSGSQASFITTTCLQRLGIIPQHATMKVTGIGKSLSKRIKRCASLELHPVNESVAVDNKSLMVKAYVMDTITGLVPKYKASIDKSAIAGYQLADRHFDKPGSIDILLGMDVYPDIMSLESPVSKNGLFLQPTMFGWIVSGRALDISDGGEATATALYGSVEVIAEENLDNILSRFWELEEVQKSKPWSLEEKSCEDHFQRTHQRLDNGRYQVTLPLRTTSKTPLGNSRRRAVALYEKLEKRWSNDSQHELKHRGNLEEYFELGHAEIVPKADLAKPVSKSFYMPHHGVEKPTSTTTKYRTVFNASAKSSSGVSLNDQLMIGPPLQQSVFEILARFKTYQVAFSADIEKMYRQILVAQQDRDFHRFLYSMKGQKIEDYRMTTVTFGVASSAHHAQRCLVQLAQDEASNYPLACPIIERDMYMDDCLSGASCTERALEIQRQLIECLGSAGFRLRKWVSNDPELLNAVKSSDREELTVYDLDLDGSVTKTLGVQWHPLMDKMSYFVKPLDDNLPLDSFTKRFLISDTAKIFDPLGTLAPTIMKAKLLFKELWRSGVDWDSPMPDDIRNSYLSWRRELNMLNNFSFDRCIIPGKSKPCEYQLHGFSDASELGYAAVIYLRTSYEDGSVTVCLVAAKTKVAPMKIVTIPRLELCGAYLLSELIVTTRNALQLPNVTIHAWCDSTVTLDWISGDPGRWKIFVARRVSKIQDNVPPARWRHCPTSLNPSDCASRSLMPSQLLDHHLWWNGPEFISLDDSAWPERHRQSTESINIMSEAKTVKLASCLIQQDVLNVQSLFDMFPYSSLDKIIRITAWCLRWRLPKHERPVGSLTVKELDKALVVWIKRVQEDSYSHEISLLKAGEPLLKKCNLLPLCPFLDELGILRVGGRLRNSNLPYSAKHQLLLPRKHRFTSLVIDQIHRRNLHATPRWMLATLRQKYWIVNAMEILRRYCHKCVFCRRFRAETLQQIMGDLPADRVRPSARCFLKTGVDYAGHFIIKSKLGRNPQRYKVWIAFFVCLATKACHIEIVSSLHTDTFLAAFRRFVSRRGLVNDMYSDNATTFHGADNDLRQFINSLDTNENFSKALAKDKIQWHFSPAKGSHFGGLWESGIKNMKTLLNSELSSNVLTYEELETLTCQIEACLNSRPITELSSDPNDLDYLSPGHFLIGSPLTAVPEPDLTGIKLNRLDRWQLVQSMFQKIWKRYSVEYLHSLQQRRKWLETGRNVQVNDLVLIKDEGLPSLKWPMARVINLHPGADGNVRVVTVKTAFGVYKRPVVKLSLLIPNEEL